MKRNLNFAHGRDRTKTVKIHKHRVRFWCLAKGIYWFYSQHAFLKNSSFLQQFKGKLGAWFG